MEQTTVIMSKLTPPITSSFYMRRSSLIKKMKTNTPKKLTLLHSGAGYGKSSALAQYYTDSKELFSWYTITAEDDDIHPFLRYLLHSIRRVIPTFGDSLLDRELISMYPKEEELTQWYSLFSNELAKVEEAFTIVLDDFHLIDHVFHINYIVEKIIEFLPPHIQLVVASRIRPRWSILLKLKLKGQLVEISEKDFMFSEEEIQVFFEDYFEKTITFEEAEEIMRRTEGWAIAIHLIAMQLAETSKQLHELFDPALKDLFSYLSDEVFSRMTIDDQQSLLNFSVFPIFTTANIRDFFGVAEESNLERLAGSHAFIQALSETGSYRFHALFQQYLETKWLQKDSVLYYDIQKRVANYFSDQHDMIQAIHHAVKAKDERFLAEMILRFSESMIKAGQFDRLLDLLKDHLPEEIKNTYYELYFYEGESQRYRAFYEKAKRAYETCKQMASQKQNLLYLSRANAGLAHIYLDTIQPKIAKPYLEEAIQWSEKSTDMSQLEKLLLKRVLAENLVNLGKAEEANRWVKKEKLDPTILREGNLDARILLRTGRLQEAQKLLRNRIHDEISLPDSHRETEVLLSFIYSLMGQLEEAKIAAIKGIETGKREKSGFVEAVGWIRRGHAEILENGFDLETPETYYVKAVQRMEELNVSRGKAEPYMGLSIVKARQGLLSEAVSYGEQGLRETDKGNDYWLSAYILICLTIVYCENERLDKATQTVQEAMQLFRNSGDVYGEMVANFWLMYIHYALKEDNPFKRYAESFAALCLRYDFEFFLKKRTILGPVDLQLLYPIIQKALVCSPNSPNLQAVAVMLTIQKERKYPGYQLNLQLLGPFTLYRSTSEVNEKSWQRDKAKELFIYMYLHRNRFVPKEELMHALWGEGDDKTNDRDFKVTLNALLKVLEPSRLAREESFFIIRKQSMYRLSPVACITSDLEAFSAYVEKGMNERDPFMAKEWLFKAVKCYKGDLLEDKVAIDWITHERETAHHRYLLALERLAQTCTRIKEFEQTIYWADRLLRIDPTWEEGYRLLMFAHYQLQNRTQAVKWYNRCVSILKEELKIEPMDTTVQMYEMITSFG